MPKKRHHNTVDAVSAKKRSLRASQNGCLAAHLGEVHKSIYRKVTPVLRGCSATALQVEPDGSSTERGLALTRVTNKALLTRARERCGKL